MYIMCAQVSGVVDGVFAFGPGGEQRGSIVAEAEAAAVEKAVQAGANPSSCQVISWQLLNPHDANVLIRPEGCSCTLRRPFHPLLASLMDKEQQAIQTPVRAVLHLCRKVQRLRGHTNSGRAFGRQQGERALQAQVVSREEVPLAYLPGGVTRVRIRVVGDLTVTQRAPDATKGSDQASPHGQPAAAAAAAAEERGVDASASAFGMAGATDSTSRQAGLNEGSKLGDTQTGRAGGAHASAAAGSIPQEPEAELWMPQASHLATPPPLSLQLFDTGTL